MLEFPGAENKFFEDIFCFPWNSTGLNNAQGNRTWRLKGRATVGTRSEKSESEGKVHVIRPALFVHDRSLQCHPSDIDNARLLQRLRALGKQRKGRPPPFKEQFARLDFQSIQAGTCLLYRLNAFTYSVSAELALAVLDGAPIPESVPLATLSLSAIAPNFPSPTRPKPEALPRLIQVLDFKPIPHVTDMFYNLRTYGPIHSLKLDTPIGCVVKFWHESNALVAQMKPVDVAGTKVKLDAYDPNTIFCNVITRTISSMYDY